MSDRDGSKGAVTLYKLGKDNLMPEALKSKSMLHSHQLLVLKAIVNMDHKKLIEILLTSV